MRHSQIALHEIAHFSYGIGLFAIFSSAFSSYFVSREKATLALPISLSRFPHDYVIFHWSIFVGSKRIIDLIGGPGSVESVLSS